MPLTSDPIAPSQRDAELARESSRQLAPIAAAGSATVEVKISPQPEKTETVILPRGAIQLLVQFLTEMSQGHAVTLMPIHAQLTTQQAAEILGVSRPFIIKEIKQNRLAYQKVGTHRRIAFTDLMKYKQQYLATHNKAMDELVQEAQELGMGY